MEFSVFKDADGIVKTLIRLLKKKLRIIMIAAVQCSELHVCCFCYAPNFEKVGDILVSACPYVCMYVCTYVFMFEISS